MIDVLIPVLNRPHRAQLLVDSLSKSTKVPITVFFICSPNDGEEIAACKKTGAEVLIVPWAAARGDYPRKINYGYANTHQEWLFTGADDLRFHQRWAEHALGCDKRVIGTADLGNPESRRSGNFSTHVLVARSYVSELGTIDGPGQVLSEAYDHNWCDRELSATARHRGEWAYARTAVVEHLHFHWGKSKEDATYRKGLRNFDSDRRTYVTRMKRAGIRVR